MEIKPRQELIDEVAEQKKAESVPEDNPSTKDNEQVKDSIGSDESPSITHKQVDRSSIYPDPDNPRPDSTEDTKNEDQDDEDKSSKPISMQIPSLFILALFGVVLQVTSAYSSLKVYTKYHQLIHLSIAVLIPLIIKAVGVFLSFYLLFGRNREGILTILNLFLVLLVLILVLTLLAGGLWLWILLALQVLYIAFIVHVKNKVREADLK